MQACIKWTKQCWKTSQNCYTFLRICVISQMDALGYTGIRSRETEGKDDCEKEETR